MNKITISVDDEVYRRARIKAAELGTSVSALVKRYLIGLAVQKADFERRKRMQNELLAQIRSKSFSASDRLTRGEVHERKRR